MLCNPDETGKKSMVDTYGVLKLRKVFCDGLDEEPMSFADLDNMTRFVVLFIDDESPYYREKDYDLRMQACFVHLKIGISLQKKIQNRCLTFLAMITEYLKLSNNPRFEAWLSIKMLFHSLTEQARSPVGLDEMSINDRIKLTTQLRTLAQEVLEADHLLFPDAKTAKYVSQTVTQVNYAEKFALR